VKHQTPNSKRRGSTKRQASIKDGTDNEVSKVKEKVPGAIFTTASGLPKILAMHAC
jgi:hypothetical protein